VNEIIDRRNREQSEDERRLLVSSLREEIKYLHEDKRLSCIEAKAWMRETIAQVIEGVCSKKITFKELAAMVREIPTEVAEELEPQKKPPA
jgi:hypothetical protein